MFGLVNLLDLATKQTMLEQRNIKTNDTKFFIIMSFIFSILKSNVY